MTSIDYIELLELPKNEVHLYEIIIASYPHWAGSEPLKLRKGSRIARLRIKVNCADCGQPIEWEPNRAFSAVRRGNKRALCGADCPSKPNKKPVMSNKGCKLPAKRVDIVRLAELPPDIPGLYRQVVAIHPHWTVPNEDWVRRGSKVAVLKFQLTCPACQAELILPYHRVAASVRNGYRMTTCGKRCTGILQRRESRPCKGCGTPITHHPGLHFCGPNCPSRRTSTLYLETQPEGLEGLHALITARAPEWIGKKPMSFRSAGWRQALHLEIQCPTCSEHFNRDLKKAAYSYRKYNSNQLYCSRSCFDNRRLIETNCKGCGELLPDAIRHKRWYCSNDCKTFKWPKLRPCNHCKTIYSAHPKNLSYCSLACARKAHSLYMKGHGYNPDAIYGALFKHMRQLILQRDKSCVVCQVTTNLAIHHVDRNKKNNSAQNLITLCSRHHRKHHSFEDNYGQTPYPWLAELAKKRTDSMLFEWIEEVEMLHKLYPQAST